MKRLALFAAASLALASCGASQPLIGLGECNGHACPGQESTGTSLTGSSATGAATSSGGALSGTASPAASSEASVAAGEPNPSAPSLSAEAAPAPRASVLPLPPPKAAPSARTGSGAPWVFPASMPAYRAQWLETPLATPDDVTARINAEGGWRYWHTLRNLPDGTKYFFVVGPSEKPDQAGWYADFQLPAVSGSGAWLVSVLLESTPAKPQAYAGLADMYKGIVKATGIPEGAPLETFKAAVDAFQLREASK